MGYIVLEKGLTKEQLQDILELEKAGSEFEKLDMKLNLEMLEQRSKEEINDFLYYEESKLVGFLGLYDIDKKANEIEITGMVHPKYRRRGIFTELFEAAKIECSNRDPKNLLLISEKSSVAGAGFINTTDAIYTFSEYRMRFEGSEVPDCKKAGITLRKADKKDRSELAKMDSEFFGKPEDEAKGETEVESEVKPETETETEKNPQEDYSDNPDRITYIAELDGKTVGKIGTIIGGTGGYIFGVGILPEFRGRGYGRELLGLALNKLISERIYNVILEVAVKNENALHLYKICGFKEVTVYDYYEIECGKETCSHE